MALRRRYGWNCQNVNFSHAHQLVPIGYVEVVPGETIGGKVKIFARSVPTIQVIDTRVFLDAYAFYTPYRLLDDTFPNFISEVSPTATVPTVADLFPQNFEMRFTVAATNMAWLRYNYNTIYNKFFAIKGVQDRAITDAAPLAPVPMRANRLENRPLPAGGTTAVLDTSGASVSVNVIRELFSQDAWNKMRAYYGDRYIDYLAALGVRADWAILQEPEQIGSCQGRWPFKVVQATGAVADEYAISTPRGYFAGGCDLNIRDTFCPEHGLVAIYAFVRADFLYEVVPQPQALAKNSRVHYWSPEYNTITQRNVNDFTMYDSATPEWNFPTFEEHRVAINQHTALDGQAVPMSQINTAGWYYPNDGTDSVNAYRIVDPATTSGVFDNTQLFPYDVPIQWTSDLALVRHSPVPEADIRLRVT